MPKPVVNKASTVWNGDLTSGSGKTSLDSSGAASFDMGWSARSEGVKGTNPEELIAAAHATCFSMAIAHGLSGERQYLPEQISPTPKSPSTRASPQSPHQVDSQCPGA